MPFPKAPSLTMSLPGRSRGPNEFTNNPPAFVGKLTTCAGLLSLLVLLLGLVNIGIVGYNFSYFKGTWRNNLFHSELTFLVLFCAAFIGTAVNVIANILSPQPFATHTIHELVSSAIYGFLTVLASTVFVIQLSTFGRYFVNSYEVKVFSSILGIFEGIIYLAMAAILYKDARTLTE